MGFKPGDVVTLKSGGQPMTVTAVDGESIECVWLGEEGDFFREKIPAVALEREKDDDEEEDDEEEEDEEEEEEEEEEPLRTGR